MSSKIKLLTLTILLMMTGSTLAFINLNREEITVDMTTDKDGFVPNLIHVPYRSRVTFMISNYDGPHSIQLEEFGFYDVNIPEGQVTTLQFNADKRGEFTFYCTVVCIPGQANNYGKLVIE